MGCNSSQSFDAENKNIITTENVNKEDNDEIKTSKKRGEKREEFVNKEGNKENKDNKKNKKDQRKKRDKKNQKEFKMSENDNSISDLDSNKIKQKKKQKLRDSKKRDDSEKSEEEDNIKEENTEGMATVETKKLNFKKKENEGLLIMDGVEDLIPEDLTEEDIYQLVQDALGDNIVENEEERTSGTITRKQAKSIASILYKKLRKKKGKHNIDISDYPELKGLNIKIGAGELTKEVVKNMMFNDEKIDQSEIDETYAKLTKKSSNIKALTIELITDDINSNIQNDKNS